MKKCNVKLNVYLKDYVWYLFTINIILAYKVRIYHYIVDENKLSLLETNFYLQFIKTKLIKRICVHEI